MSDEPEYLICLQCETPTYQFEYHNGKLSLAICNTCGADHLPEDHKFCGVCGADLKKAVA